MTTPTTQPSEEAMAAAAAIEEEMWDKLDGALPQKSIAELIDPHFAPLRERAERADSVLALTRLLKEMSVETIIGIRNMASAPKTRKELDDMAALINGIEL